MTCTQQQLDDVLESLIALTDAASPALQCDLLARLVLALSAEVDDASRLQAAIASVARSAGRSLQPALP
jgi:hypothetical protein